MSTVQQFYPRLLDSVSDLRRRWRSARVIEGGLLAFAVTAGVLLALLALDNTLHPDTLGRGVLALVLWGTLIASVLTLVVKRVLEDRRDDYFAALAEQAFPSLGNRFINALQLGRGNQDGHSPDLIERIVRDAADQTADVDLGQSIDPQPSRRAGAVAFGVAAVAALYAVVAPSHFANAMQRVLLPWADVPPYTSTRVPETGVKPGDTRVPEGVSVPVTATVEGTIPARNPVLHRSASDGRWLPLEMKPASETGKFAAVLPAASDTFDYYITAGDGRSRKFRVTVVKRPEVAKLTVSVQPPAYTGRPATAPAETSGEVAGVAGSVVTYTLTARKPLKEARLLCENGAAVDLQQAGDLTTWQAKFLVWPADAKEPADANGLPVVPGPTRYQVRMVDTDGYRDTDDDDHSPRRLWHTLAVLRDQPPAVAVTVPGRDLTVQPGESVKFEIDAQDDFGVREARLLYQRETDAQPVELAKFAADGPAATQAKFSHVWDLQGLKNGDRLVYWAAVSDHNTLTGPGTAESRKYRLVVFEPEASAARADQKISDYIDILADLVRRQKDARAQTFSASPFPKLVDQQADIRERTRKLARLMEADPLPLRPIWGKLDVLTAGLMPLAIKFLEAGRDAADTAKAAPHRAAAVETQDRIIKDLEDLLARMQRGEQARKELRTLEKKDRAKAQETKKALVQTVKNLDSFIKDSTEFLKGFERLPKKPGEDAKEDEYKVPAKDLEEFKARAEKWAKGSVNEMTKMASGFVDDFNLKQDVNSIFEEVEKKAKGKSETIPVALEDMGVGLATKMKEDLEMWLPDAADAVKWVMEEPDRNKPFKVPEMPLPDALQDIIGDLLQKAEEFDEEADDVTSAWGDNLDQAGWGVADGPISSFSAKGKTGNDMPNNQEVTGRSGDGRRGKSKGQMVGDTSRALQGRKTPARVGDEKYEPGQLKQEGSQDPNGATGGGKKAGSGRKGLQGGTPPDATKDIGRLSEKQAGMQEKADEVAKKLDTLGISGKKMLEGMKLFEQSVKDMRDARYEDAARRRKEGLNLMRSVLNDVDPSAARAVSKAKDLPPELRQEMLQAADEGLPAGYESLLKNYYKALSGAEK
jgi:hypothetical protein